MVDILMVIILEGDRYLF